MSDRDEWRSAVRGSSEMDRVVAVEDPRRAIGLVGDAEDDL